MKLQILGMTRMLSKFEKRERVGLNKTIPSSQPEVTEGIGIGNLAILPSLVGKKSST